MSCEYPTQARTATFWTTQPDACGDFVNCEGDTCGSIGLSYTAPRTDPRSIVNTGWLRGLAINMLNTDARKPDTLCGMRPGAIAGHWSESYNANGPKVGTHLRELTPKGTLREIIQIVKLELQTTLAKLVTYGVAVKVDVEVEYRGNATLSAIMTLHTTSGTSQSIGLTAKKAGNKWAWM